jgi:hypothetical protein
MAATASMATTRSAFSMTTGTTLTAVILTILLNGFTDINNAQAGFAGTFHLSHGSHGRFPFIDTIGLTPEQSFTLNTLTHEQTFRY